MGRKLLSSSSIAILLSAPAAGAATTEHFDHAAFQAAAEVATVVVDFEETQRGNALALGGEFSEQGLTLVQRDGGPMNVVTVSDASGFAYVANANSPEQVLSSSISLGGAFTDASDHFDFVFARPKRVAGLWIGNVDPGSTVVEFLDAGGNVLASETLTGAHPDLVGSPGGPNRLFYGVVSDPPVARIRTVEGPGDSDGVTYDDVEFEAASEFFDHAAFAAQAGWTRVTRDFELAATSLTGTEYSESSPAGLRIVNRAAGPISIVTVGAGAAFAANANSGTKVLSASIDPTGAFSDAADDFDFVFDQPMRSAGVWVGNLDPGTTELQFLDEAGGVLASELLDSAHAGVIGAAGGANRVFYGIVSDAPIARIRTLDPAGDADGVTFDDVEFGPDLSATPRIRVLTTNIWQGFPNAAARQEKLVSRIRALGPDLIAFQEARQSGIAIALAELGYDVRHQGDFDEGVLIASRWPIEPTLADPVSLVVAGATDYQYALVRGVIQAPAPFGDVYFLNAKPAWMTSQADQRYEQARITMGVIDDDVAAGGAAEGLLQIVAGDFDDAPTTPSIRFLRSSPHFLRDSWVEAGDGSPGHTFAQPAVGSPERFNEYALPYTGPNDPPGAYEFGNRRIDYLFVRNHGTARGRWETSRVVFDGKGEEWISGHYGVLGDLRLVPEPSATTLGAGALAALLALRVRRRPAPAPAP